MSRRILVVEDQEDNRQILRDLLSSVGYEMTEAWDGEAGVAAAGRVLSSFEENTPQIFEQMEKLCLG